MTDFSECKDRGAVKRIHKLLHYNEAKRCLSKDTVTLIQRDLKKLYGKEEKKDKEAKT